MLSSALECLRHYSGLICGLRGNHGQQIVKLRWRRPLSAGLQVFEHLDNRILAGDKGVQRIFHSVESSH